MFEIAQGLRVIGEQGEQMTEDEKSSVEAALTDLKSTLETEGSSNDDIQSKMDALITASQAMAQRLYAQAAEQSAAEGGEETPNDDDVVEAEIVDEDDDQS